MIENKLQLTQEFPVVDLEKITEKMPRRFVRDSKFRHVFGEPFKRANCYDNITVTKNVWDGGKYCAVNSKFIAVVLENSSGSSFMVLPIEKVRIFIFFENH